MKDLTPAIGKRLHCFTGSSTPILLVTLLLMANAARPAFGQGCVSARHMPSSISYDISALAEFELMSSEADTESDEALFGEGAKDTLPARPELPRAANDPSVLDGGDFEVGISLRALKAEDVFVGNEEIQAAKDADVNPIGEFRTLDLSLTYGLNRMWSLTLNLPLVSNDGNFRMGDGLRHPLATGFQLGDLRIGASRWLFDPDKRRSGNVVLGFGIKAPTGAADVPDQFFSADGPTVLPIDGALQPGDGGWGVSFQAQAFQLVARRTYYYGDVAYLLSPRETSGVVTPASAAQGLTLSVTDQYLARSGFGYLIAPRRGISASLGLRIDGIPVHDLVGGSGGFRRPGYSLAAEPALNITFGPHLFSLQLPLAIRRSRQQSAPEANLGIHPGGSMADEQFILSYSRRY